MSDPDPRPAPATEPGSDLPAPVADDLAGIEHQVGRPEPGSAGTDEGGPGAGEASTPGGDAGAVSDGGSVTEPEPDGVAVARLLAESRLADLQRERAEFVNYRRRVERDRDLASVEGRTSVLVALLPVLDDVEGARTHGDLVGPFAAVADKLDASLRRLGLESFGEPGDPFDPTLHEALLQDGATEVAVPTCTQVLQRGYRLGDRILRPARVAVASPA